MMYVHGVQPAWLKPECLLAQYDLLELLGFQLLGRPRPPEISPSTYTV